MKERVKGNLQAGRPTSVSRVRKPSDDTLKFQKYHQGLGNLTISDQYYGSKSRETSIRWLRTCLTAEFISRTLIVSCSCSHVTLLLPRTENDVCFSSKAKAQTRSSAPWKIKIIAAVICFHSCRSFCIPYVISIP